MFLQKSMFHRLTCLVLTLALAQTAIILPSTNSIDLASISLSNSLAPSSNSIPPISLGTIEPPNQGLFGQSLSMSDQTFDLTPLSAQNQKIDLAPVDSGVYEDITNDQSKYKTVLDKVKDQYSWASDFLVFKAQQETGGSHSIKLSLKKVNNKTGKKSSEIEEAIFVINPSSNAVSLAQYIHVKGYSHEQIRKEVSDLCSSVPELKDYQLASATTESKATGGSTGQLVLKMKKGGSQVSAYSYNYHKKQWTSVYGL